MSVIDRVESIIGDVGDVESSLRELKDELRESECADWVFTCLSCGESWSYASKALHSTPDKSICPIAICPQCLWAEVKQRRTQMADLARSLKGTVDNWEEVG